MVDLRAVVDVEDVDGAIGLVDPVDNPVGAAALWPAALPVREIDPRAAAADDGYWLRSPSGSSARSYVLAFGGLCSRNVPPIAATGFQAEQTGPRAGPAPAGPACCRGTR